MKKELLGKNALLEIGMEELPARFATPTHLQLSEIAKNTFTESGLDYKSLQVWGTPRRLVLFIEGLSVKAKDRTDLAIGPPPASAKNTEGHWLPAAIGFAKAQKVSPEKLILQNTPKGERYCVIHAIKGQKTEILLKDLFPQIIKSLVFPKTMIWEESQFKFARPIRWFVALFGTSVIRFTIAGVTSDRTSIGLLSLGGLKIPIAKPEKFKSLLQGRCILIDPEERRKNIKTQIETIAKKIKAQPLVTDEHLNEVVHLNEYPSSILGHIPDKYLMLPKEILVSVLKKHQKFFPLANSKGQLMNMFVGVRNGPSDAQENVREGYERVINARLSDANFFFQHDSKLSFDDLSEKLKGVGFHPKLGSLWDKTERVKSLVEILGNHLHIDPKIIRQSFRTAQIAKADLLTLIVGEFPELQGIAGRFYMTGKESDEVATAIEQHYWPITAESNLPESMPAILLSLADKIDTLGANFSVGIMPTGSADPYGLRRLGTGIIRILIENKFKISIRELLDLAFAELNKIPNKDPKALHVLETFLIQRTQQFFLNAGYRPDEVDAVLVKRDKSLILMSETLLALQEIRKKEQFDSLTVAIKRAKNILKQAKEKGMAPKSKLMDAGLLQDESEKKLFSVIETIRPQVEGFIASSQYKEAFLSLVTLRNPVDEFFNKVMVMTDDINLREARLALLQGVEELFDGLIDFSKLQGMSTVAP
ncbi:MAG: glycine--tRNA ligase subunit beta [Elusimicrobiota bacterium]